MAVTKQIVAVAAAVGIWILLLPVLLIRDHTGSLVPHWRSIFLVGLGVLIAAVACWLVWTAASRLVGAEISLFAAHPGPVLLTDGIYGRVRNPMNLGNTLAALAPAVAIDVDSLWIMPLVAFLYYAFGQERLENSYLKAKFGAEFEDYKARVPAWTPLWK